MYKKYNWSRIINGIVFSVFWVFELHFDCVKVIHQILDFSKFLPYDRKIKSTRKLSKNQTKNN